MTPLSFRYSPISEASARSPLAVEGRLEKFVGLLEQSRTAVAVFKDLGTFALAVVRKCVEKGFGAEEVVAAFNHSRVLDVVNVEEPKTQGGGTAVEVVFRMRNKNWRAKLARPTEPANHGKVRLTTCRRFLMRGDTFPLFCDWHTGEAPVDAGTAGDFFQLVDDLETRLLQRRTALADWKPVVDLGELTLGVPFPVRRNHGDLADEALSLLMSGHADVFAFDMPENRRYPHLPAGLSLWLPELNCTATIVSAPNPGAGPNDLLLVGLEPRESSPDCLLPLVRASWQTGIFLGPCESSWRDALKRQFEDGLRNVESAAPLDPCHSGAFHVSFGTHWMSANIETTGFTLETLCEALSRGAESTPGPVRNGSPTLLVHPHESDWWFTLQDGRWPSHRRVRACDWNLISIHPYPGEHPRSFAHVRAKWVESSADLPDLEMGNRDWLVNELTLGWAEEKKRRGELADAQGIPKDLEEKVDLLVRLHDLARQLLDVGLVSLERLEDGSFLWGPRKPKRVRDELNRLREDNPEGVSWERYGLKLFDSPTEDKRYIKLIFSPDNDWESIGDEDADPAPSRFRVLVGEPANAGRVEQLASRLSERPDDAGSIRVILASVEWDRIHEAITLFDPRKDITRTSRLIDERQLSPSIVTFHLLRRVMVDPESLSVAPEPPELTEEPLANLSEAQRLAVRRAVHGPDITLIQGPPGTGKSTVIIEIIRQLFKHFANDADFRILFVAPTHAAVDNVLERLVKVDDNGLIPALEMGVTPYRLGPTKKIAPHLRDLIHDCFHSSFLEDLRRRNQESVANYHSERSQYEVARKYLKKGIRRDVKAWSEVVRYGKRWPKHLGLPSIPDDLSAEHAEKAKTQHGRTQLWREFAARRARKPDELFDLLLEWTKFVEEKAEFMNQLQAAAANLICATSVGCATAKHLNSQIYDYVIVDEAGKEEWRKLLLPLLRGHRWILVGDHKQLPPFADDELKTMAIEHDLPLEIVTRSLFEELQSILRERGRFVFLDRQGRMHPDISVFVSQTFYPEEELKDFDDVAKNALPGPAWLPDAPMLQLLDTSSLDEEKRREQNPEPGKYLNLEEAELAIRLVLAFAALPEWQAEKKNFGIIAPYGRQMKTIQAMADGHELLADLIKKGRLQIGTVDSFQGQERNLIVFSNTRSNKDGKLGFMDDLQRLNVALSRAKSRLLVITDTLTIANDKTKDDTEADQEIRSGLRELLKHVSRTGGLVAIPSDWREKWPEH